MNVTSLPAQEKFDLKSYNSKEAFKRAVNIFLATLLNQRDSNSGQFNYVCREVLEFLDLHKDGAYISESYENLKEIIPGRLEEEKEEMENFVDIYMRQMDFKAANKHVVSDGAFIPGNLEDIV